MKKYNIDKLIKVSVLAERLNKDYEWLPVKKIFFGLITTRKEGLYAFWSSEARDEQSLPPHNILRDKKVYRTPLVIWYFQDGFRVESEFSSYEEARLCVEKTLEGKNLNLIEFK